MRNEGDDLPMLEVSELHNSIHLHRYIYLTTLYTYLPFYLHIEWFHS